MSQKETLLKVLYDDPNKWWYSYDLIKANTKYGWLGTSADRVARRLAEDNLIEKQEKGQFIQFKVNPLAPVDIWRVDGRIIKVKV